MSGTKTYNEKFPRGAFLPLGELPVADFIVPSEDFECNEYLCETHAKDHVHFALATALDADILCSVCRNAFHAGHLNEKLGRLIAHIKASGEENV